MSGRRSAHGRSPEGVLKDLGANALVARSGSGPAAAL